MVLLAYVPEESEPQSYANRPPSQSYRHLFSGTPPAVYAAQMQTRRA